MPKSIKYSSQSVVFVLTIFGFVAVINYISTKWFRRVDMTENKMYSVSDATRTILKDMDDIVNIKAYFSKDLPSRLKPVAQEVRDILGEYKAYAGKNLQITWEDPADDDEIKNQAQSYGVPEIQVQAIEKDKAQVIKAFMGIVIVYEDAKELLGMVTDLRNFEFNLTQAIMKVQREETPKIGVLKTDTSVYIPPEVARKMQMNMSDPTESKYKPIFDNLKENYDVTTVDISNGEKVNTDFTTLIIPGGDDVSFTERDLFEIDQYFMSGGNLIVLVDAVGVDMSRGLQGKVQDPRIIELMEHYGVRVEKNMVLDASCGQVQIPQQVGPFQMNVPMPYPYFVRVVETGFYKDNPAVGTLQDLILPWPSSLTLLVDEADTTAEAADTNQIEAVVLAKSSQKSWTATGFFNLDPRQEWNPPEGDLKQSNLVAYLNGPFKSYFAGEIIPPVKKPADDDTISQIQLSAADQEREVSSDVTNAHLLVVGDSDFLTAQNAAPSNISFLMNVVDWLSLDKSLISIRTRAQVDRTMTTDMLKEGNSRANFIRYTNVLLMPVILIIIGLVIWMRRREVESTSPAAPASSPSPEKKEESNS
ncbi:MAG: hypothetical protein GF398_18385 [Chitinivibrionales bacterium]|nr:hypothetical protein [Chitinivibrionales bacterium]